MTAEHVIHTPRHPSWDPEPARGCEPCRDNLRVLIMLDQARASSPRGMGYGVCRLPWATLVVGRAGS